MNPAYSIDLDCLSDLLAPEDWPSLDLADTGSSGNLAADAIVRKFSIDVGIPDQLPRLFEQTAGMFQNSLIDTPKIVL